MGYFDPPSKRYCNHTGFIGGPTIFEDCDGNCICKVCGFKLTEEEVEAVKPLVGLQRYTKDPAENVVGIDIKHKSFDMRWNTMYINLARYIKENGIPNKGYTVIKYNGLAIGSWLSSQRNKFNKGELSKEKYEKLKALGIDLKNLGGFRTRKE